MSMKPEPVVPHDVTGRTWDLPVLRAMEREVARLRWRRPAAELAVLWADDPVLASFDIDTTLQILAAPHPRRPLLFRALAARAATDPAAGLLCLWGLVPVLVSYSSRTRTPVSEMITATADVLGTVANIDPDDDPLLVAAGRAVARGHRSSLRQHHEVIDAPDPTTWLYPSTANTVEATVIARHQLAVIADALTSGTIDRARWELILTYRLHPGSRYPTATQRSHMWRTAQQLNARVAA